MCHTLMCLPSRIPEFRYGILLQSSTDTLAPLERSDHLLYQLQAIFTHLQESQQPVYDASGEWGMHQQSTRASPSPSCVCPCMVLLFTLVVRSSGFCAAYKDFEGNCMSHTIQMDVNEFFNVLFDKLEAALKGSPQVSTSQQRQRMPWRSNDADADADHVYVIDVYRRSSSTNSSVVRFRISSSVVKVHIGRSVWRRSIS